MILPTKHLGIRQSLIGSGAFVVRHIRRPRKVEGLWRDVQAEGHIKSYKKFLLTIDALYMLGMVDLVEGRVALIKVKREE